MENSSHKIKRSSASILFKSKETTKVRRAELDRRKQVILLLKSQRKVKIRYEKDISREVISELFLKRYKISTSNISKIADFADQYSLQIDAIIEEIGLVYLSGEIVNIEKAFNVEMHEYEYRKEIKRYRQSIIGHEGNHSLPASISSVVTGVIGLSDVPLMHNLPAHVLPTKDHFFSAAKGLNPSWFADYYNFPKEYKGKGQKIAIVSCGGGITRKNIEHYFKSLGLGKPPKVKYVSVGGVENLPGSNFVADFEIATDCLIAMTAALESQVEIYSTVNSIKGFSQAVLQIANGGENAPKIISYSWGTNETNYSRAEIKCVNRILKYATLVKGITIFCATGDAGSTNKYVTAKNTPLGVQFPASSPWVTSCGGTMINTDEEGSVVSEEAWNSPTNLYDILIQNATGGGFSKTNKRPDYQKGAIKLRSYPLKGRGLPDISAHADLSPRGIGYWIRVNGQDWVSGGTSSVAPLMAALTARLNEGCQRSIGFLNPLLYEMARTNAIKSIDRGNNSMRNGPKKWKARKGWDPCTGLGVPDGTEILKYLKEHFSQ